MNCKAIFIASLVCGSTFLTGCVNPNDPNWNSGPSYGNSSPYGSGYSDPYYNERYENDREKERLRDARRDAERERERLERERERLEEERARANQHRYEAPPRREEHCPSGYSPSENKCSNEERRRGCKDMRLPGGLGCVHR